MIGSFIRNGFDRSAFFVILVLVAAAIVVPALALYTTPASPFHIPGYAIPLMGKYLTYGLLAL